MELRFTTFFDPALKRGYPEYDVEALNIPGTVEAIFDHFGITYGPITLTGGRNEGRKSSVLADQDYDEARVLLALLPGDVLERVTNPYGLKDLASNR